MDKLARLTKVDLREGWQSEAGDFTPWLAKCENLKLLGEAIGLELECEGQEQRVGPFRADILCKDTATDAWVLIENQLEDTDHTHLGQLITYAAGLEAVTIVWVAAQFRDEHRAALDWLNERTDEKINFFALEVELWRIGDSPVAPKFNVVCQPNGWRRYVADAAKAAALTDRGQLQFGYWSAFLKRLRDRGRMSISSREGRDANWIGFGIGSSYFRLWTQMYFRDKSLGVGMTCKAPHAKRNYSLLLRRAKEIENELGFPLEWEEEPDSSYSYIAVYQPVASFDESEWAKQHDWMAERLEAFHRVMPKFIRDLPPVDEPEHAPVH